MCRWFVQGWPFTTSPFDWPTRRGFVVASNRTEACDNARTLWRMPPTFIVHAYSECDYPISEVSQ